MTVLGPAFLRLDVGPRLQPLPTAVSCAARDLVSSAPCFLTIPEDSDERKILVFLLTQIILALEQVTRVLEIVQCFLVLHFLKKENLSKSVSTLCIWRWRGRFFSDNSDAEGANGWGTPLGWVLGPVLCEGLCSEILLNTPNRNGQPTSFRVLWVRVLCVIRAQKRRNQDFNYNLSASKSVSGHLGQGLRPEALCASISPSTEWEYESSPAGRIKWHDPLNMIQRSPH